MIVKHASIALAGRRATGSMLSGLMVFLAAASGCLAMADPLKDLDGRWSGWGAIVHSSGSSEQVKCVATYFVKEAGRRVQQNLRCASAGYNIDAVAQLEIANGEVKGDWEERTYSSQGTVSGRVTDQGLSLSIQGAQFSAAMAVTTSACKQSISIAPRGFEISRISIGLGKC